MTKKLVAKIKRKKSFANKDKVPEVKATPISVNKNTTMYVSYAKDIFCELCKDPERNRHDLMEECIKLVKQARGEFE